MCHQFLDMTGFETGFFSIQSGGFRAILKLHGPNSLASWRLKWWNINILLKFTPKNGRTQSSWAISFQSYWRHEVWWFGLGRVVVCLWCGFVPWLCERVEVVKMFSFLVISTHFANGQPFTLLVIFSWTNIAWIVCPWSFGWVSATTTHLEVHRRGGYHTMRGRGTSGQGII